MRGSVKRIIFLLSFISLFGCSTYDLEYFRHYETHHVLIGKAKEKDFNELSEFSFQGILVVPGFKSFRESHPGPYAQLTFLSETARELILKKIEVFSDTNAVVISKDLNQLIKINRELDPNQFRSLSITVFNGADLKPSELLSSQMVTLIVTLSDVDSSESKEISLKLKKRAVTEISWPT